MRHDQRSHRRRVGGIECGDVQVPVTRVRIDEHGAGADGVNAQEVAGVVVGAEEDFITRPDLEGTKGKLDGEGAAAAGEGEGNAEVLLQPGFEVGDVRPKVFAPGAIGVGRLERVGDVVIGHGPVGRALRAHRCAAQDSRQRWHALTLSPGRHRRHGRGERDV